MEKNTKHTLIVVIVLSIITSSVFGSVMGFWAGLVVLGRVDTPGIISRIIGSLNISSAITQTQVISVEENSAVVNVVEKTRPAVVSIIVTKDLPVIERYYSQPFGSDFFEDFFGYRRPQYRQNGTETREVGGGSGFLISTDGHIVTNKHVVLDDEADYTVLMNDESKHEATVLARDPFNDLAILKIEGEDWLHLEMGDSTNLEVGQRVIAIGNALG